MDTERERVFSHKSVSFGHLLSAALHWYLRSGGHQLQSSSGKACVGLDNISAASRKPHWPVLTSFWGDVQVFRLLLCHILMPVLSSMVCLRPWTFLSSPDWSISAGRSLWCWKALCGPPFCCVGGPLLGLCEAPTDFCDCTRRCTSHFQLFICYF